MLTEYCVYTIASRDKLDPVALEQAPFVNQEARVWATASGLLERTRASGQGMPILFADALDCTRLLYWGLLQEIRPLDGRTEYVVDRLRSFPGRHKPQELLLRKTGEPIAPGFIRPYALCQTPAFLEAHSEAPVLLPGEGPSEGTMTEGPTMQVTVNAYERSARGAAAMHRSLRLSVRGLRSRF